MSRHGRICIRVVVFSAAVLWTAFAEAAQIELSLFSSEPGIPAEWLTASMDFAVNGDELTLTVSNDTTDPPSAFEINSIAFNATEEVTDLTLISGPAEWTLDFNQVPGNQQGMDGFGRFDAKLDWGGGQDPTILPGQEAVFTFDIEGSGFSDLSFVTDLSVSPPGVSMLAAAKFFRGTVADSAFGATDVPEPGSLCLLATGGLALMRRRRRR